MSQHYSIAIDGPSGAGKSTIAKAIARDMHYLYLDTGAMYRAFGLFAIKNGVDFSGEWSNKRNEKSLIALLNDFDLDVRYVDGVQRVFVGGEDYTDFIRTNEVSKAASAVAVVSAVRLKMVELQRKIAAGANVVMDGRDIGTYVLPNAAVKVFVTASPLARAKRRYKELLEKGDDSHTFEQVYSDMIERDKNDSSRAFAPLSRADDAALLDTTDIGLEESIAAVQNIVLTKLGLK
ncbi:MAG: (d)CMP kinase [Clostridia bacterium]|nr:(d)CMP kinase [Clostridia bacterium]